MRSIPQTSQLTLQGNIVFDHLGDILAVRNRLEIRYVNFTTQVPFQFVSPQTKKNKQKNKDIFKIKYK